MRHANLIADELKKIGFRTKVVASNSVEIYGNTLFAVKSGINHIFKNVTDKPQFNFTATNYGTLLTWN